MTNQDLCEAFVRGETSGVCGNLFIDGNKLYSYGKHYVLCERVKLDKGGIFFVINDTYYSATTRKHQAYIRREVCSAGKDFLEILDCNYSKEFLICLLSNLSTEISKKEKTFARTKNAVTGKRLERLKNERSELEGSFEKLYGSNTYHYMCQLDNLADQNKGV